MTKKEGCPFSNTYSTLKSTKLLERHYSREEDIMMIDESQLGTKVWFVNGYDVAKTFLKDSRLSVERVHASPDWVAHKQNSFTRGLRHLLSTEHDSGHRELRKLISKPFTSQAIEKLKPAIEKIAADLLDKIELSDSNEIDLFQTFARPFALTTGAYLLGVPSDDLIGLLDDLRLLVNPDTFDTAERQASETAIQAYIANLLEKKSPLDSGILGILLSAFKRGELTHLEYVGMSYIILSTTEVSVNLLRSAIRVALTCSDVKKVFSEENVTEAALDELLRLASPNRLLMARYAKTAIVFRNVKINPGDVVFIHIGAANRDKRYFKNPDQFDVSNVAENSHLVFGWGAHYCLGRFFVYRQLEIGLKSLFTRFPRMALLKDECPLDWETSMHFRKIDSIRTCLDTTKTMMSVDV